MILFFIINLFLTSAKPMDMDRRHRHAMGKVAKNSPKRWQKLAGGT
jgi:hypothetical protein